MNIHSLHLHQDPGQIPPEVPNIPAPQPEIQPNSTPEPEIAPLPGDPASPESPTGPEITPDPGYPEVPQPMDPVGMAARLLH